MISDWPIPMVAPIWNDMRSIMLSNFGAKCADCRSTVLALHFGEEIHELHLGVFGAPLRRKSNYWCFFQVTRWPP